MKKLKFIYFFGRRLAIWCWLWLFCWGLTFILFGLEIPRGDLFLFLNFCCFLMSVLLFPWSLSFWFWWCWVFFYLWVLVDIFCCIWRRKIEVGGGSYRLLCLRSHFPIWGWTWVTGWYCFSFWVFQLNLLKESGCWWSYPSMFLLSIWQWDHIYQTSIDNTYCWW